MSGPTQGRNNLQHDLVIYSFYFPLHILLHKINPRTRILLNIDGVFIYTVKLCPLNKNIYFFPHAETVVSLTKVVRTDERKLIGLIGIDLPLANLLEDVTHFTSPAHSYAFVMDAQGVY